MCICMWVVDVHIGAGVYRGQTKTLELELQALARCLVWVLGPELRTPGGAAHALNH